MDDRARKQANDLLTLCLSQTPVKAGSNLGKEITGLLGHNIAQRRVCGCHTGL